MLCVASVGYIWTIYCVHIGMVHTYAMNHICISSQIYRFIERTGSHYVGLMGLVLVPSSTLETAQAHRYKRLVKLSLQV